MKLAGDTLARESFRGRSTEARTSELSMSELLERGRAGKPLPLELRRDGRGTLHYAAWLRYASAARELQAQDQGIDRAGNGRWRAISVQLAWQWVRCQPSSALTQWYTRRFGASGARGRRIGIVALARKLVIALWRYAIAGVVPEGAIDTLHARAVELGAAAIGPKLVDAAGRPEVSFGPMLTPLAELRQRKLVRLAASDTARRSMGYPRPQIDRPGHDATVDRLRAALGGEAFSDAWAEGAGLSLDDVVAYARRARGARARPSTGWASLTPTELDVVSLVAEGLTNPEIGARLFISRATVKTHLSHVYAKLDVSNRTELAALAGLQSGRGDQSPAAGSSS